MNEAFDPTHDPDKAFKPRVQRDEVEITVNAPNSITINNLNAWLEEHFSDIGETFPPTDKPTVSVKFIRGTFYICIGGMLFIAMTAAGAAAQVETVKLAEKVKEVARWFERAIATIKKAQLKEWLEKLAPAIGVTSATGKFFLITYLSLDNWRGMADKIHRVFQGQCCKGMTTKKVFIEILKTIAWAPPSAIVGTTFGVIITPFSWDQLKETIEKHGFTGNYYRALVHLAESRPFILASIVSSFVPNYLATPGVMRYSWSLLLNRLKEGRRLWREGTRAEKTKYMVETLSILGITAMTTVGVENFFEFWRDQEIGPSYTGISTRWVTYPAGAFSVFYLGLLNFLGANGLVPKVFGTTWDLFTTTGFRRLRVHDTEDSLTHVTQTTLDEYEALKKVSPTLPASNRILVIHGKKSLKELVHNFIARLYLLKTAETTEGKADASKNAHAAYNELRESLYTAQRMGLNCTGFILGLFIAGLGAFPGLFQADFLGQKILAILAFVSSLVVEWVPTWALTYLLLDTLCDFIRARACTTSKQLPNLGPTTIKLPEEMSALEAVSATKEDYEEIPDSEYGDRAVAYANGRCGNVSQFFRKIGTALSNIKHSCCGRREDAEQPLLLYGKGIQ